MSLLALLACSICGLDPAATALSLDRPAAGQVRLAVEDRLLSKEAADEGEREDRLAVKLQLTPAARFGLQLELPFFLFRDHFASGALDDRARGLGDIAIGARYDLLRAGGLLATHVLSVSVSVKVPTGLNTRALPGKEIDEHLQLGSGSVDWTAGLSYLGVIDEDTSVFALAQARINGDNGRSFHYGNALFGSLGLRRALFDSRIMLSLEAQARSAGMDRAAGLPDPDSGGKVFYATAGLAAQLTRRLMVRGQLQAPVASALYGEQAEHAVAHAGIAYDWDL